jgi:putative transposase
MKKKRFTEEQIIGTLREQEAGAKAADLARKYAVSETTLYNWKAKFGGMDVSEAKRLKALGEENARLKKLLADQMLDAAALRDLSERWACRIVAIDRKTARYRSKRPAGAELVAELRDLANARHASRSSMFMALPREYQLHSGSLRATIECRLCVRHLQVDSLARRGVRMDVV